MTRIFRTASGDSSPSLARILVVWGRLTGAALFAVVGVLVVLLLLDVAVYRPKVDLGVEGTSAVRRAHAAMLDQQAGLRGYLLSGDERFLEAHRRGAAELPELNAEATALLAGDDRFGELLFETRLAQEAWLERWAEPALERGAAGSEVDDTFVELDKELFDEYRDNYELLVSELVASRESALDGQRTMTLIAIAVALGVTIAAGVLGRRRTRDMRRAVAEPLDALVGRLDQIGAGDLAPRPLTSGPEEFRRLAAGVEHTAAELASSRAAAETHALQLLDRSRRQAEVLTFAREVAGSLSMRYVLRGVCTHSASVADGARVVVWLIDPARRSFEPVADSTGPDLAALGVEPIAAGDGVVGRAGQYGRIQGVARDGAAADEGIAIPMVVGAQVIGVLQFLGEHVSELSPDAIELIETMAIHAAVAIEGARMHERTTDMALTDVLTGLPNRRRLDDDLAVECASADRHQRPLAVLMVDVDHFKAYNDEFGHQAGDVALQAVARLLSNDLRTGDRAYRYGGEEFVVMLRETDGAGASAIGERLRASIEHYFSAPSELRQVTISVGVAELEGRLPTPEALIAAADTALYEAKRAGRNQVAKALAVTD